MHAKRSLLWLYLLFLLVILAQSTWWLIFIERQGGNKTRLQLQHLELDLAHARSLVDNSPAIFATEGERLDEQFPDLIFHSAEGRHSVSINPAAKHVSLGGGIFPHLTPLRSRYGFSGPPA